MRKMLLFCAFIRFVNFAFEELFMKWETPSYTDLRFGFEVTMYIYNR
jgi:pyrroloquinoline quinone biosynthesis protein A